MSFYLNDPNDSTSLHVSAGCGNLEGKNVLWKEVLLYNDKYGVTDFMVAAQSGKM
jgi:hypothetical protein